MNMSKIEGIFNTLQASKDNFELCLIEHLNKAIQEFKAETSTDISAISVKIRNFKVEDVGVDMQIGDIVISGIYKH